MKRRIFRRSVFVSLFIVLLGSSVVLAQMEESVEEPAPLAVLFVGNSYTHGNNLPGMVQAMYESSGDRSIVIQRHTSGGCTLKRHIEEEETLERIRERPWDVVVLQEQSLTPVVMRPSMFEAARVLHQAIQEQGSRTVFYLTWARQHIPEMQEGLPLPQSFDVTETQAPEIRDALSYARRMFGLVRTEADFKDWVAENRLGLEEGLSGAYLGIAEELGAETAPVGVAWSQALGEPNPLKLHAADKSHASHEGTYLAACVFYATLFDETPVGLPPHLELEGQVLVNLTPEDAERLQQIAAETVLGKTVGEEVSVDPVEVEPEEAEQIVPEATEPEAGPMENELEEHDAEETELMESLAEESPIDATESPYVEEREE
jgi:hypothetical protein